MTLEDGKRVYDETCGCHDAGQMNAPQIGKTEFWQERLDEDGFLSLRGVLQPPYYQRQPGDCAASRGACQTCDDAEIMAALKYMLSESQVRGDYNLW